MIYIKVALLFFACVSSAFGTQQSTDVRWLIEKPSSKNIAFKGMLNRDDAGGGTQSFLYPNTGQGFVGLLAGILTHGIINNTQRKSEEDRILGGADRVSAPYSTHIEKFTLDQLFEAALKTKLLNGKVQLATTLDTLADRYLLKITPVFFIVQDEKAILLDCVIAIHKDSWAPDTVYKKNIKILSDSLIDAEAKTYWLNTDGGKLKSTMAQLLAMSIALAISTEELEKDGLPKSTIGEFKTVRYLEGRTEKIERSKIVEVRCNRAVLLTLNGDLFWVPLKPNHTYPLTFNEDTKCDHLNPVSGLN